MDLENSSGRWLVCCIPSYVNCRVVPELMCHHSVRRTFRVAKQVVNDRLASKSPQRKDMLASFLRHGLSREEAEGEALVNIIAGSDTTATAIRTTMLYLMSSPQVYRKLAHEIRAAAADGKLSSPITDEEARGLPYLQAVIKEGLRVFPPVTGLMPTMVPPGGDVICGIHLPEGTEIGWSAFGVQHNKGVYGMDAETFRPERWLEAKDEEQLRAMNSTWELVFKYGKWQCLGRSVALMELNKVFVEVSPATPCPKADPGLLLFFPHLDQYINLRGWTDSSSIRLWPSQPAVTLELVQRRYFHPVRPGC